MRAPNKPDNFILDIVLIDDVAQTPRDFRRPFQREPDFGETSNYDLNALLKRSGAPC